MFSLRRKVIKTNVQVNISFKEIINNNKKETNKN